MYKVEGLKKLSDYANALGVASPEIDCDITSIKFDSRHSKSNDLFIPLKGQKFNGEDFTESALNNGAAAITEKSLNGLTLNVKNIYETCKKLMDNGVTINRPPRDGHMAFVRSPDGISIEILQEGDSLPMEEPWKSMENSGSW